MLRSVPLSPGAPGEGARVRGKNESNDLLTVLFFEKKCYTTDTKNSYFPQKLHIKMKIERNNGFFLLILAQIMVGLNIVAAKLVLTSIDMINLLVIRFITAAILLYGLHLFTKDARKSIFCHLSILTRTDWIYLLLQALSAGVLFNCLMLLGLNHTDANVAGIITSALPAMIAIFSWLLLGEKLTSKSLFSVVLTSVGLVIIGIGQLKQISIHHAISGDLLVLVSLIPEAAYYVLCKIHRVNLPIFLMSAIVNAINGFVMVALTTIMHKHIHHMNLEILFILLILGITSGLFYVFWYYGCQKTDGLTASLTTAFMPLSSVCLAWLILGEQLSLLQGIGMSCVILSIIVYARR